MANWFVLARVHLLLDQTLVVPDELLPVSVNLFHQFTIEIEWLFLIHMLKKVICRA